MSNSTSSPTRLRWRAAAAALAIVAVGLLGWLGLRLGWLQPATRQPVIVLYGFSVLDDVMQDRLLPAFQEMWLREQDEAVEFIPTFAGSGEITRRILARYPAEIAIVASELDAHRLPVPWRSWRRLPHQGILARTPLVVVVREGNPEGIRGFADLGRSGIELVHPDPATSGAAELAILAEYASARQRHADADLAFGELLAIWKNVTARPKTAREARTRFEEGTADALLTYEVDAIGSPSRSRIRGEIVYPEGTLVTEPIVVRIDKNIADQHHQVVDAFIDFLWSTPAQTMLAEYGFHGVEEGFAPATGTLAALERPLTLADAGGVEARREILEKIWKRRVVPELRR